MIEGLDAEVVHHGQPDGVDQPGGVVGQEVRPQEAVVVSYHDLVGRMSHPDSPIGRPSQVPGEALAVAGMLFLQRRLRFSHHPVLGVGEEHRRDGPVVDSGRISLSQLGQDVPGCRMALEVRHAGQLDGGGAIPDGKYSGVGGAHAGIDRNPSPPVLDARSRQLEALEVRNPASTVHYQIGSEDLPRPGLDPESRRRLLDRRDLDPGVDLNARFPGGFYQQFDQFRVKRPQRAISYLEDYRPGAFWAQADAKMRELKGDEAPANVDEPFGQRFQFEPLVARQQVIGAGKGQRHRPGAGRHDEERGLDPLLADRQRAAVQKAGLTFEELDAGFLEALHGAVRNGGREFGLLP